MKKILVYILLFSFVCGALTACAGRETAPGEHSVREDMDQAEEKIEEGTEGLMTAVPDLNDGFVNDSDGIITEDDNGPMKNRSGALPESGAGRYTPGNAMTGEAHEEQTATASGSDTSRGEDRTTVPPATAAPEK